MKTYEKELKEIIQTRKLDYRPIYGPTILDKIYPEKPHVIAAATSFGKTYLIAAKFELYYKLGIIKPNEITLILASYQTILRDNFAGQFEEFGITSFTYAIVENKQDLEKALKDKIQVIITIPQTIEKHLNKIKKVKWLVVDEAHGWYFAQTITNIINVLNPKYRLLLTGTPFKFNLRKDDFIIDYVSVRDLYEAGLISDVSLKVLHSSVELHQLDYVKILGHLKESKKIVKGDLVDSLNQVIKQLIKILGLVNKKWDNLNNISKNYISVFNKMEKSIIYANGKDECDCIYECLKLNNVSCLKSHSSDGQDAVETFNLFKEDNSIKVLIVVNRGKEGFNFPELYNIIDFSYTQDFATTMQMIGRLLRLSNKKTDKVFYKVAPKNTSLYFMDWMNYLIQLFDNEWYEKYTGNNARQITVPNFLLSSNEQIEREQRQPRQSNGTFNTRNLNDTGMSSLKFMNDNKWFKSSDYLSVVGSTTLGQIIIKYGGNLSNRYKKDELFLSFNDAKEFVKTIDKKWRTSKAWPKYCESGEKPDFIPSSPYKVYDEWKDWPDWLNTKYLDVEDAKKIIHPLNLQSNLEWEKYCKSGEKPDNIPQNYRTVYGIGTGEFLGHNRIADHLKEFISMDELKKMCKKLGIDTKTKWYEYWKNNERPSNIPADPSAIYKRKKIWDGWTKFFNQTKRTLNTETMSFENARIFVHKLKLKNNNEWREYSKSGDKPITLPANPDRYYKKIGKWTNWPDFLGYKK